MKKTTRRILVILALGLVVFAGYNLLGIYTSYQEGNNLYDDYANQFIVTETKEKENNQSPESIDSDEDQTILKIDFNSLLEINKDVVGWIHSEDTIINYPIVQTNDNEYYLDRMVDGHYNFAGSIFMDYRNSRHFTDLNTIIYGHNMKNDSMFGTLELYKDQDYYEAHPVFNIITPEKSHEIKLIAGLIVSDNSDIYDLPKSNEELEELFDWIMSQSTFTTNLTLEEGDKLITLSTCSVEGETVRYVVVGLLKLE